MYNIFAGPSHLQKRDCGYQKNIGTLFITCTPMDIFRERPISKNIGR